MRVVLHMSTMMNISVSLRVNPADSDEGEHGDVTLPTVLQPFIVLL